MVSYKKVFDLYLNGRNISQISNETGYDRQTIRNAITKGEEKGLLASTYKELTDEQIKKMLRKESKGKDQYLQIDFEEVHQELSDEKVTLNLLHEEYEQRAKKAKLKAYSRSQFFNKYNKFANTVKYKGKLKRKPGSSIELDFAGSSVYYYDVLSASNVKATLFVATLSFSKLTYVEAIEKQNAFCFAQATINALQYFGGGCRYFIPDNTKAAVILHSKHELAILNELFREMALHYLMDVVPAPVRKPTAKSNVEDNVYNSYTRILAPLRNCKHYSLDDLNEALIEQCEIFNREPFKRNKAWSRRTLFEMEEKNYLSPLPLKTFEIRKKTTATVRENCYALSSVDNYFYSVPYQWCKKRVVMRSGTKDIKIYSEAGEFICSHKLGTNSYDRYVTEANHLPSHIRQYVYASPNLFRDRALRIGNATFEVINRLFILAERNNRVAETEFETAKGILALAKSSKKHTHRSAKYLEQACSSLLKRENHLRIGYQAVKKEVERIINAEFTKQTDEQFKQQIVSSLNQRSLMSFLEAKDE